MIALGLHSLTVAPVYAGKKLGWDGESFCEGRYTKTELQAEVCTPLLLGGEKCREVLSKLLRAVCACGAQVGEIRCGSIRADRNAAAYVMDAVMELRGFYVSDRRQGITVAAVARGEALE